MTVRQVTGLGTALVVALAIGLTASAHRDAAATPAMAVGQQGPAPLFSTQSDLVVLHVAVTDHSGAYVTGLTREAFTVYEDAAPQELTLFSAEDTPATIGLLIDDSASMHGTRELVTAGAAAFAATSNRADEIFALAFNEHVTPALPAGLEFTSDADVLRYHLHRAISARGRTALYDAVDAGLAYLQRGQHPRKALVILSDGDDNASATTLDQMIAATAASNTVIYTIAMLDPGNRDAKPKLLKRLARASGGVAYAPHDPMEIGRELTQVARDIRSSYSIAYAPPAGAPGVHRLRVVVRGADGAELHARTRTEYVK